MKDKLVMSPPHSLLHQELIGRCFGPTSQTLRYCSCASGCTESLCLAGWWSLYSRLPSSTTFLGTNKAPRPHSWDEAPQYISVVTTQRRICPFTSAGLSRRPFPAASTSTKHTCLNCSSEVMFTRTQTPTSTTNLA